MTVWTGTVSRDVSLLFVLRPDPVIFREFMTYSGFSDWGNRDIAFLDAKGELLLWTTGHESLVNVRKDRL